MRSIEISARTVAEATRLALEQLGVDEDEVMIAVLQSGDDENEALVRVSVEDDGAEEAAPPAPERTRRPVLDPEATGAYARQVLEGILERMNLEGYVTVQHSTAPGPNDEPQHSIMLYVEGLDEETVGLMIGRRGETLTFACSFCLTRSSTALQVAGRNWSSTWATIGSVVRNRWKAWRDVSPNRCAQPDGLYRSNRCKPTTAGSCTWHCARIPRYTPRALEKAKRAVSSSFRAHNNFSVGPDAPFCVHPARLCMQ